jgi:hypothetical protein
MEKPDPFGSVCATVLLPEHSMGRTVHLLGCPQQRLELRYGLWNSTARDWIKIFILRGGCIGHWAGAPNYTVIVEGNFFHTKFHFAGFDLNASFG